MSKDYTSVLDRVSHIEQACADIRRDLAAAAAVSPATAADQEGESEEITLANSEVSDYETAAKGHFADISNHVTQALALTWGSPATPSGGAVSPGTVSTPAPATAVSTPAAVSGPSASPAAPAAPAAAAPPTSTTPAATPAPAPDASAPAPAAAPTVSSTPTS